MRSMNQKGFSILEVMLTFSLLTSFVIANLVFYNSVNTNSNVARTVAARDRIVASIRNFSAMAASLRSSMRAATPAGPVNPELATCLEGSPPNSCVNGKESPFSLYQPLVAVDASGNSLATLLPMTAPKGTSTSVRYSLSGGKCATPSSDCAIVAYTTFIPQCPPPQIAPPVPAVLTAAQLAPMAQCTVAAFIRVNYEVIIDPTVLDANPSLNALYKPVTGTVLTPTKGISGNTPQ